MPFRSSRLVPLLLLTLSACSDPQPPPAALLQAPPPVSCLAALPATPLIAPVAALHAQDLAATPLDAAGLDCLGRIWGQTAFASPQTHDAAYAPVQAAHGEDQALYWQGLPHQRVQLLRIAQGAAATTWLLRIDTGLAMEGSRYDLLFTSDAQGQLRDQMLVGAEGLRYRRDMDLRSPNQFSLQETGGREETPGMAYAAAFRIDDSGRISLDPAGATAPLDPVATNSGDGAEGDSATSLEEADGPAGDAEAIRRLLFSDSGVLEETVEPQRLADGSLAMLALGRAEAAGLVLYVLRPVAPPPATGHTRYAIASLSLPAPVQALGVDPGSIAWQADAGGVSITLPLRYELPREGGDADSGEPASRSLERVLRARLDLRSSELQRSGD